jgi:tetratricopeptide (TPR) repeat protein
VDTIWLRWYLADACRAAHRYEDALRVYERLRSEYSGTNSPHEGALHLRIAICLEQLGRGAEAQTERLRGLELIPDSQRAYDVFQAQGDAYFAQSRYVEAALEYENALNVQPTDPSYRWERLHLLTNLATTLVTADRFEEAFPWTEQALMVAAQLPPETANQYLGHLHVLRASIFLERLDLVAAVEASRTCIDFAEDKSSAGLRNDGRAYLSVVLALQGWRSEAEAVLAEWTVSDDDPNDKSRKCLSQTAVLMIFGEPKEAYAVFEQTETSERQSHANWHRATLLVEFAPEEALKALQGMDWDTATVREKTHWYMVQAHALAACGAEDALTCFAELLAHTAIREKDPELGASGRQAVYYHVVKAALLLQEKETARTYLGKLRALPTTPAFEPVYAIMEGDLLALQGSFAAAREAYERAIRVPFVTGYDEQARQRWDALARKASDGPTAAVAVCGTDR